jgi:hypothetical protein
MTIDPRSLFCLTGCAVRIAQRMVSTCYSQSMFSASHEFQVIIPDNSNNIDTALPVREF